MSQTLTQHYSKYFLKQKKKTFRVLPFILATLFVVVFVVCSVWISNNKAKNYGLKEFYIVYAGKYTTTGQAAEACTAVADRGGAGVVYSIGNTKFIVASIYFSLEDANSVKEQILPAFDNSDVIKISAPSLGKSVCNQIEKLPFCKQYYNNLYAFCKDLFVLTQKLDKGEISAGEVYKKVMQYKQKFVDICANMSSLTDKQSAAMQSSGLLIVEQISSFFDSAFVANSVAKNLKKLYVNTIFEFVDMCNSIK